MTPDTPQVARLEGHITTDPAVMVGKPVVRNTRITVELVLEHLAAGWSIPDLTRNYPRLTPEDVHACVAYARSAPAFLKRIMDEASAEAERDGLTPEILKSVLDER